MYVDDDVDADDADAHHSMGYGRAMIVISIARSERTAYFNNTLFVGASGSGDALTRAGRQR